MLKNEIQPEVSRFKNEVTTQVQNFQVFIDNLKADFQKQYQMLSEEVSQLKQRNHLAFLADKSISEGDRAAFNELEKIFKSEQKSALKIAADAELRRVVSFWTLMNTTEYQSIQVRLKDGTIKKDDQIPTRQLISDILSNQDWEIRAVAARLLHQRNEKGVPEILLKAAREDTHLEVVKYATLSFKFITNSTIGGIFNIDGYEQWWKEHSVEVNERLREMN